MRSHTWLLIAASLAAPYAAVAAPQPTPAATAAPHRAPAAKPTAGATEVTTAYGNIPASLAGTWFVVLNSKVGDRYINGWQVYRITHHGAAWQVTELHGTATTLLEQELAAANAQAIPFSPSAAVLAATKDLLPTLKQPAPAFRALTIALRSRGHFVKRPVKDPRLDWAKLVIEFLAKGENVKAAGQTYYVKETAADRLSGEMNTASVATGYAGTVVPISIEGPFTMYRIE